MSDRENPVWVRLVGAVMLLAIVAGSAVIVGRGAPASRRVPSPSNPDGEPPSETAETEAPTELISPSEITELQECIAKDATLANKTPGARLRKLLGKSDAGGKPNAAFTDLVQVASDVEQLRGFRFTSPFKTRFVTSDKISDLVGKPISAKQAVVEDLALGALGVLRPGQHVSELYGDLVTDQVAGFYRPRLDQLVVPSPEDGGSLGPFDKSVLAHELEHALVDQSLDLSHVLRRKRADRDGSLAALAVVEGSATLTGYRWTQSGLSFFDQLALTNDPRVAGADEMPALPSYLVRQFTFPYLEGLHFVCKLYDRGGWRLVNRALRKPPATTLEILSPELYLESRKTLTIPKPSSPGPAWKHVVGTTFGAANWIWLFEAPRDDPALGFENAEGLGTEWAGGELHVWTRGDDVAVAVVGKSTGRDSFCRSLRRWKEISFHGRDRSTALSCPQNTIRLGIGPNQATARAVVK